MYDNMPTSTTEEEEKKTNKIKKDKKKKPIIINNELGPNIKTVLGDRIYWDTLKLPLRGCSTKDPTQLWRCRKHKRLEAAMLRQLAPNSSVLDCGAHFGDTVMTLAVHAAAARTINRQDLRFFAFEPCRRKCQFMRTTVRKNNLQSSVSIINACVGDQCRSNVKQVQETNYAKYDGRTAYSADDNQEEENDTATASTDNGDDNGAITKTTTTTIANDDFNDKEEEEIVRRSMYYYNRGGGDDDKGEQQHPEEEEEDSGSESDSDSDDDDDTTIRMISLDSMKDLIMPVGLIHLDVEGWEAEAIRGARRILQETACENNNKCYVIAEVWNKLDWERRQRWNKGGCSSTPLDNNKPPDVSVLEAMEEYGGGKFKRLKDIVDQERNLVFEYDPSSSSSGNEVLPVVENGFL